MLSVAGAAVAEALAVWAEGVGGAGGGVGGAAGERCTDDLGAHAGKHNTRLCTLARRSHGKHTTFACDRPPRTIQLGVY
jgi:hypothetical protein